MPRNIAEELFQQRNSMLPANEELNTAWIADEVRFPVLVSASFKSLCA